MGLMQFRFHPPEIAARLPELSSAYVTGQDRTPGRGAVEVRPGLLVCQRESPESGRLHVPWPVRGHGVPVVATATLAERQEPYDLAVELARGRLNDVRNQTADWAMLGLQVPPALESVIGEARRAFARAATSRDDPTTAAAQAQLSLAASLRACDVLMDSYIEQVLRRRREYAQRLPTLISCTLSGDPRKSPIAETLRPCLNATRIDCTWARLAPSEGRIRWEEFDSQLSWTLSNRLVPTAGPLIELRPGALPDWLWLWSGDFDEILGMAVDVVRQAVTRYRGKVAIWHLVHRAGTGEILGLSEEQQVRLTARLIQVARQADPQVQLVVDFDRPWADWLSSGPFQLGPLHMADSLARAELGMTGIGLELAPGYGSPGSHLRDLLDVSRLLDLYALVNLPLDVTIVLPSGAEPDPQADAGIEVRADQWPRPLDERRHRKWASRWIALAVAKPYVRSVNWAQASDSTPHLFPHGGLLRADDSPKPIVDWLRQFRGDYLS